MLKSILLVLDESECSYAAQNLAINLAIKFDAHVTAIGIIDEPWVKAPSAMPIGAAALKAQLNEKFLKNAKLRVLQLEKKFTKIAKERKCDQSIIHVVGSPTPEIAKVIVSYDVLLLGRDANFHFFADSKELNDSVEAILKDNPRPIILTSPEDHAGKSILITYDGSTASARAIHLALLLKVYEGLDVHIITVDENEEIAQSNAEKVKNLFKHHGIDPQIHAIKSKEKPGKIIADVANKINCAMLVLGAYGHSGIKVFFKGSTMRDLVKLIKTPMFLYH